VPFRCTQRTRCLSAVSGTIRRGVYRGTQDAPAPERFLIQRLEGSRGGTFELCILNSGACGKSWQSGNVMLKGVSAGGREVYFARPRAALAATKTHVWQQRRETRCRSSHGCRLAGSGEDRHRSSIGLSRLMRTIGHRIVDKSKAAVVRKQLFPKTQLRPEPDLIEPAVASRVGVKRRGGDESSSRNSGKGLIDEVRSREHADDHQGRGLPSARPKPPG
jgi:hypothetical protein